METVGLNPSCCPEGACEVSSFAGTNTAAVRSRETLACFRGIYRLPVTFVWEVISRILVHVVAIEMSGLLALIVRVDMDGCVQYNTRKR